MAPPIGLMPPWRVYIEDAPLLRTFSAFTMSCGASMVASTWRDSAAPTVGPRPGATLCSGSMEQDECSIDPRGVWAEPNGEPEAVGLQVQRRDIAGVCTDRISG